MNWDNFDDKQKVKKDRHYVSCDEPYELTDFVNRYGQSAVDLCCRKVAAPRTREEFEKCLKDLAR